ncbi:MAG: SRPBCC family protein [Candidatus Obscuribacterales bacterium]|nr:SRPBCC family protein [Candidatus Obscuribacterales bacterium]
MLKNLVNSFAPVLSLTSTKRKAGRDFTGIVISLFCLSFCNTAGVAVANPEPPATEVKSITEGSEAMSSIFRKRFLLDTESKRLVRAISVFDVAVPAKAVREVLSDFSKFPEFMKRIKTVEVVRREGNMTFTQSYLKPQFLVNQPLNHTITDVYSKPNTIEWVLVDGNFPSASGRWEIEPLTPHTCRVRYTVAVEPGPFIPPHLVSFALKMVQKEVITGVKTRVQDFKNRDTATGLGSPAASPQHLKHEHPLQAHAGTDPV